LLFELLSSEPARDFLHSLVFTDSKRPVTVNILRRLSLSVLARDLGKYEKLDALLKDSTADKHNKQVFFLMEDEKKWQSSLH
jgi:hypothetical protein